jgi:prolyl-tRNA synthetase
MAPIHAAIVPIYRKAHEKEAGCAKADALAAELRGAGLTVEVDTREELRPGAKYFHWEQRGVPVRVEIGPRDIKDDAVMIKRRDADDKQKVPMAALTATLTALMETMQGELLAAARQRMDDNTVLVDSHDDFRALMEPVTAERGGGKFAMVQWCGSPECEAALKETKATIRCIPLEDRHGGGGACLVCGKDSPRRVVAGKAY